MKLNFLGPLTLEESQKLFHMIWFKKLESTESERVFRK